MEITVRFTSDEQARIESQARSAGLSTEEWLRRIARERSFDDSASAAKVETPRPISEVIAEIMSDVPKEELAKLPKDGASQVDHYVYGHPKR